MKQRVVVFDLDETLGFFSSLGVYCDCLNYVLEDDQFYQNNFDKIMALYPEFLRPGIIHILKYLKTKKRSNICSKVMIYTNNQGPCEWAVQIKDYLDGLINYKLFDHIIAAFKVNGRRIEIGRTSHDKTIGDFLNCTNLPVNTQVFFLDDQHHMGMEDNNVYYLNLFPYVHYLAWDIMNERFWDTFSYKINMSKKQFISLMMEYINKYNINVVHKNPDEYAAEPVISKTIINHMSDFFSDEDSIPINITTKSNGNRVTKKKKIKK